MPYPHYYIVYVDIETNTLGTILYDMNDAECEQISEGHHPTKWLCLFGGGTLEQAKQYAERVKATLRWELRRKKDQYCIFPTYQRKPGDIRYSSVAEHINGPNFLTIGVYTSYAAAAYDLIKRLQ